MAAHKSQLSEAHDRGRQALSSWLVESGQSSDEHRLAARMLELPPSESSAYLPALIEMIKSDLQQQWQWGRQKLVESYLEVLPELGSPDAIPLELILAEFEARRRSGSPAAFAELAARFPRQAAALRQVIGQSEETPTETVPENAGTAAPRPRRAPRSLAGVPKVPVKLPKEFGRYRIIKRLGRGAMGSVYLAHDAQLDRRVALKVPHFRTEGGARSPDRHDLDRFYREARTAATLDHPNLCPVFDVGQIDGIHYLSMAYIKGRPLSDYVDPDKPMPPRRVAAVVRKLALALEVAHAQGVVHRDLKPSNIMVNSRRELIIMDFGLAWRIGGSDERLTKTGMVLGTPSYMSPEQISGNPEALGPRCDVYSLGVIMYELLTASRPFEGPEAIVMGQILFIEPAPPSGHRPDLDPQIEAICLKAMAKRPGERYATMGELAAALDKYLRHRNLPPRPSPTVVALPEVPEADGAGVPESGTQSQAIPPAEPGCAPGGEPEQVQPTERPGTPDDHATLQKSWHQWTTIVEIFALRRSSQHVDWQAYHNLHQELIEACRARAAAVDETKRAFYRQLEDLVLPWLTPKALAQTDREILFSLLLFCRQAEQELGRQTSEPQESGDRPSARTNWVLDMVIFVVVTIITGLLLRILITS
jgi:serine/threonine protein kinase